jgi:two-component system cell cycle sensor histidine kinase/response regulator CckA
VSQVPTWEEIFTVMSAASVGDADARVKLPDEPDVEDRATRFAVALNLLLDDLAVRAAELEREAETRRATEARVRAMVDSALDAVIGIDRDGRVIEWNHRAETLFGWTHDDVLGRPLVSLIIPERYRDAHRAGLERYNRTGEGPVLGKLIELAAIDRGGREFPVELSIQPVQAQSGTFFTAFVRDISDRVRLIAELREERERFQRAFERNPSGLTMARQSDRTIIEANPAFLTMVGYERDEVVGRRASEVGFSDELLLREIRTDLDRIGVVRGKEMSLRTKSGDTREVIGSFELADLRGESVILGSFLDVTERRTAERRREELETRLRQSERLESLGQLAGGVAHDLNNILSITWNYADFLAERFPPGDPGHDDLTQIRRAAERGRAFTRQLLTFARRGAVLPTELQLSELLSELRSMLGRALPESIAFDLNVAADVWSIVADRGQIEQVVLNLVVNAGDAMPEGGRLVVEAANVEYDDVTAQQHGDLSPGRYVLLSVTDTGHGMSPEVVARAFEPFFTTKREGRGTGLGLATVYGIVKQAGGRVSIYSEVGRGTTVRVLLPAIMPSVGPKVAAPAPIVVHHGGVILLVEDEDAVREAARRILQSAGYEVLAAASGEEALALAAARDEAIDLLLSDMVMPGMSGRELARRLAAARPEIRVVYMSGYSDEPISHARNGVATTLVQKPFTRDPLLAAVAETLAEGC